MQNILSEKFLERLSLIIPKKQHSSVWAALEKEPQLTFRINALRTTPDEVTELLTQDGFLLQQIDWYKDAFMVKNKSVRQLTDTALYKEGKIYIQNLSSMLPSLILDPKPEEKILDMAASPGSKTTHLASLMQNTGEIIANDISRQRLFKLQSNLRQQGVMNTKIINLPGQMLWKKYPNYFDAVLVDAPCSMEGLIRIHDEASFKDWSYKKVKILAERQKYLLRSAVACTKPGGRIIYSTCTLSPEENEMVTHWVCEKERNIVGLEDISHTGAPFVPGITSWNKMSDENLAKTRRILPSHIMEGFFIAKLRKRSLDA